MQIFRKYIYFLWQSFSSTHFYTTLDTYSYKVILLFWLVSITLHAILPTLIIAAKLPTFKKNAKVLLTRGIEHYPNDLQISWDGTQLHSNQKDLTIPLPPEFKDLFSYSDTLAYINTSSEYTETILPLTTASPILVISENELSIQTPAQEYTTVNLKQFRHDVPPFTLTKENLGEHYTAVLQWYDAHETKYMVVFSLLFIVSSVLAALVLTIYSLVLTTIIFLGVKQSRRFVLPPIKCAFVGFVPAFIATQWSYFLLGASYQIGSPVLYLFLLGYILFTQRKKLLK